MGKSSPKAPDYASLAEQTAKSSNEAAIRDTWANRANQNTPWGSLSWDSQSAIDPATGQRVTEWTQNVNLTPESQAALDSQQALTQQRSDLAGSLMGRVYGEYGNPVDWSQVNALQNGPQAGTLNPNAVQGNIGGANDYANQAGNALMSQFNERMDPQFAQDQARMDTTLRNRGLKPGDAAYDDALAKLRQSQGDQRNQAMYQAQQLTGTEAQRLQGMDLSQAGLFNTANQQAFSQAAQAGAQNFSQGQAAAAFNNQLSNQQLQQIMQQRGFSLNEINALLSGQQVSAPGFGSYSQATGQTGTDYMGAAQNQYQAALDASNASNSFINNLLGAGSSILGSYLGGK